MYTAIGKTLPIDPDFDIRKHIQRLIENNTSAYDNFAILLGMLNDSPCQTITFRYQDAQYLLQWLKSTSINPVNIFIREHCLAFSRERKITTWFAFLQQSIMIHGSQDLISINYTHQAGEDVIHLYDHINKLFNQHNTYAGKIYIVDEENSKFAMAKLKDYQDDEKRISDEYESIFQKIVEAFSKKEKTRGIVVIAGEDQKSVSRFIVRLTRAISRRFLYITQKDSPNIEYEFLDRSFGKGNNVFIVEHAEEYPKIKDTFEESLAGYIQNLLKGKLKEAYEEPLIVTLTGKLDDFALLNKISPNIVIAKIQF